MPKRVTVNVLTGAIEEVEMVGEELAGFEASIIPPVRFQATEPFMRQVRTTGAAPAEIFRATLGQMTACRARLVVLAIDSGNGAYASLEKIVSVERLGAGAVNLLTTDTVVQRMTGAAAVTAGVASWAVAVTLAGNDIVVRVTGATGRTVDWGMSGEVMRYAPGGVI